MKTKLIATFLIVALQGCASVQPVAPPHVNAASEHVFDKSYMLGVESSVYVGEPIVKVKDYYETVRQAELLSATESFRMFVPPFFHADISEGSTAVVKGTTNRDGKTYRLAQLHGDTVLTALLFLLNDDGSLEGSAINTSGSMMGYSYHPDPASAKFVGKTVTKVDTSKGSKNFELVYSGATKDSINVLYREYTPEDLARAAFSQNLVYAKDSTTIRFREFIIKVIEASNERMRFVVEADGLK